jgi:hypothetical protein
MQMGGHLHALTAAAERTPQCQFGRRLDGFPSGCARLGEENTLLCLMAFELTFFSYPARSLVTIPTELSQRVVSSMCFGYVVHITSGA